MVDDMVLMHHVIFAMDHHHAWIITAPHHPSSVGHRRLAGRGPALGR
jgi:hypothetical protein